MAYSKTRANRVRERMSTLQNVEEKAMMGGLTFMYNGKMCVGIMKDQLMCRIDPALKPELMERSGVNDMLFTGRAMKGFVLVDESALKKETNLDFLDRAGGGVQWAGTSI